MCVATTSSTNKHSWGDTTYQVCCSKVDKPVHKAFTRGRLKCCVHCHINVKGFMNIKNVPLNTIKLEGIFVLQHDFDTGDMELQFSNADFLNALRTEHLIEFHEWSDAATLAYYVDVFRYSMYHNDVEGYLRDLYPIHTLMDITRKGLHTMNATDHLELFDKLHGRVQSLDKEWLDKWLVHSESDKALEDWLFELDGEIKALEKKKPLLELSCNWMKKHPDFQVLSQDQWDEKLLAFSKLVPNMEERIEIKLAKESRSMKISRALCKLAGLDFIQQGSYSNLIIDGEEVLATGLKTEQGDYMFYEIAFNNAYLRKHNSDATVAELETGEDFK